MGEEIYEKIKVWAFFDDKPSAPAAIFPIAISWRRRLIKLDKLIFAGTKKVAGGRVVNLVCGGEGANFELEYNTLTYSWRLLRTLPK